MSRVDVVRAWKSNAFRTQLSRADVTNLPEHPAGSVLKVGGEMKSAGNSTTNAQATTAWFCTLHTVGGSRCCV